MDLFLVSIFVSALFFALVAIRLGVPNKGLRLALSVAVIGLFALFLTRHSGASLRSPSGDIARPEVDIAQTFGDTCKAHDMTIVDAGAHWCGHCKHMDEVTFADPAVKAAIANDGLVKVYEEESPEVIRALGVDGYPTVVFLDRKCHEVHRVDGYLPPGPFLNEVRVARGKLPAAQ